MPTPANVSKDFAAAMEALGPFEAAPHLAVAVSGGADSMALALLAHKWAGGKGGTVTALSVNHDLRREAAAECRQVRDWMADNGITHKTLRWPGVKPHSGIQAAARQARYKLLAQWCRSHNVLHLLTAHHGDDQAETLLLRLDKNSGVEGLAGMAKGRVLSGGRVRLLRPLLDRRHDDLTTFLKARKQPWLQDPSNQDTKFARVRARQQLTGDSRRTEQLLTMAREAGHERRKLRDALADLAARSVQLHPAGYCLFDPRPFQDQHAALFQPLLGDLLRCIGGGTYRPRRERLRNLAQDVLNKGSGGGLAGGRTLAGTRILTYRDRILICREAGRLPAAEGLRAAKSGHWGRFAWRLGKTDVSDLSVGALGGFGWRQVRNRAQVAFPGPVNPVLPALWRQGQVIAVPHLKLTPSDDAHEWEREITFSAQFLPQNALQPDGLMLL
ncbi:MAG: tRNA lysidine(34) synthetase TilS [Alphaproteobacteria bacterium]|jgi:tRNA(Ile)-lysidine synthase|nr:tRNA lysidine(34) synthetase TilS [Alphaproteobacteria bacterium]